MSSCFIFPSYFWCIACSMHASNYSLNFDSTEAIRNNLYSLLASLICTLIIVVFTHSPSTDPLSPTTCQPLCWFIGHSSKRQIDMRSVEKELLVHLGQPKSSQFIVMQCENAEIRALLWGRPWVLGRKRCLSKCCEERVEANSEVGGSQPENTGGGMSESWKGRWDPDKEGPHGYRKEWQDTEPFKQENHIFKLF